MKFPARDPSTVTAARPHQPSSLFRVVTRAGVQALCGAAIVGLGLLALVLPLLHLDGGTFALGLLVLAAGGVQVALAYATLDGERQRLALGSAAAALVTGALLIAAGDLVFGALVLLLGLSWMVDGGRTLARLRHRADGRSRLVMLFDASVAIGIGVAIAVQWPFSGVWAVYLATGLRLIALGWSAMLGRDAVSGQATDVRTLHPDAHIGLSPSPEFSTLRRAWEARQRGRAWVDGYWVATLLVTFFLIHVTRMPANRTAIGVLSAALAVGGDVVVALIIAYVLVVPARLGWRFLTRPVERRLWARRLGEAPRGLWDRFVTGWLRGRFAFALRLEQARRSPAWALRRGLQIGLPPTAVLVAIAPLLGISWYFNTETWPTALWDHWAAYRTDAWREAMTAASATAAAPTGNRPFAIDPGPVADGEDFAFVVIGDPGEGDASQHVLRDQYLALGARPDVRFLVVSSDVIYPQGAMGDYEPKFYLPFKGFGKPVYALPGNHDWYDALEAFTANFLEPAAARAAMRARLDADRRLSGTNEAVIERMVAEAARLREQYGVRAGLQRGPYFEWQAPGFALVAVDTGILRSIDPPQMAWLRGVLERSRGKTIMVLAGHPLYAAGRGTTVVGDPYGEFHQLLREHGVSLVMAGDTHDFEAYGERYDVAGRPARQMLHVVNGGGGAYLSIGTALDWPAEPATPDWAIYPPRSAVVAKLDAETPAWKRPAWWWVRRFHGWPASSETLASAFASDRAPFYQSFVEVRVEPSRRRVRVLPYGPHGRLRWRDCDTGGELRPPDARPDDEVEFVVPATHP